MQGQLLLKRRFWRLEDIFPGMTKMARVITDYSENGWHGPPYLTHAPLPARIGDMLQMKRNGKTYTGKISYTKQSPTTYHEKLNKHFRKPTQKHIKIHNHTQKH